MSIKEFCNLNLFKKCREYGVSVWQCPQFLFLIMGIFTIIAIIAISFIGRYFADPVIVIFILLGVTLLLFIINFIIVHSFERVVETLKSKSEFISIMSHRLRTPISINKWQLNLFSTEENHEKEEVDELIHGVNEQNEEMLRIVNDLLEINHIESNSIVLIKESFSLKELVEKITKPFNIQVFATDNLLNVFADKIKIKNVLNHIINNALSYGSEKEKISIDIKEDRNKIRCSVHDYGIGILKEDEKNIFRKFFRSKSSKENKFGGIGVGLYISKHVVEASGGEMGFNSSKENGTTFWFTLPILKIDK